MLLHDHKLCDLNSEERQNIEVVQIFRSYNKGNICKLIE